jgi:hypothetical protein
MSRESTGIFSRPYFEAGVSDAAEIKKTWFGFFEEGGGSNGSNKGTIDGGRVALCRLYN